MSILIAVSACSDDSADSCEVLRNDYRRLHGTWDSSTSWSDIQSLQENVAERMALEARIAERCE